MRERARRRLARWAFWLTAALVGLLALAPAMPSALAHTGGDKVNHFMAFLVLGVLGRAAYGREAVGAMICLLGYGGLIEIAQAFTPTRQSEWGDLLADALGLALAHLAGTVLNPGSLRRLQAPVLGLPRAAKQAVVLGTDAFLCVLATWVAIALRTEGWWQWSGAHSWAVAGSLLLALPLFVSFGLYRPVFRYNDGGSAAMVWAWTLYALLYALPFGVIGVDGVPRTVGITQPPLLLLAVAASRMLARHCLRGSPKRRNW